MKKLFAFIFVLFFVSSLRSQPAPDSLAGMYSGTCYFKSESGAVSITTVNLRVDSIDTSLCRVYFVNPGCFYFGGNYSIFYTLYNYCENPPFNFYFLFYDQDSLKISYINMPSGPPNFGSQTRTYHAKRVSPLMVKTSPLDLPSAELFLYPQPASDIIYLQSTQVTFIQKEKPLLYDISGKQITLPIQFINANTYKLDVTNVEAGIYFVVIKSDKGVLREKIMVQR